MPSLDWLVMLCLMPPRTWLALLAARALLAHIQLAVDPQGLPAFNGVDSSSQLTIIVKLISVPSSPTSKTVMKMLKNTESKMESCGTPPVTGHQSDVTPFAIIL
ncbi:hypothetical protein BTVI_106390 [Pitangus sulphuratus]|nr:hypothetical protein BTVI_106390 [Pitangus sulphuratus]